MQQMQHKPIFRNEFRHEIKTNWLVGSPRSCINRLVTDIMATATLKGQWKIFLHPRHVSHFRCDGVLQQFWLRSVVSRRPMSHCWVPWTGAMSLRSAPLTPAQSVQQQSHQPTGISNKTCRTNTLLPDRVNAVWL